MLNHIATPGPSLAVAQALLGWRLSIHRLVATFGPEYCLYTLRSCQLQIARHRSRYGSKAFGSTILGAGGEHLHCRIGNTFAVLDMPLLCQIVLPLVVPTLVTWFWGGYEDMMGCERRSPGLLWHHLDRIVCWVRSCSELDKPRFVTDSIGCTNMNWLPVAPCASSSSVTLDYKFLPMQFSFNVFSDLLGM